jgi:hypothetical protein
MIIKSLKGESQVSDSGKPGFPGPTLVLVFSMILAGFFHFSVARCSQNFTSVYSPDEIL